MRLSARVSVHLSFGLRMLLLICAFSLFSLASPFSANAQANSVPNYVRPNVEANVPQNQHTLVQSVTIEVMAALICQLSGIDVIDPQKGCLGINTQTNKLGYSQDNNEQKLGGLIGMGTGMIGGLYTPPASGVSYMHHLASNFGIVKSANAQCIDPFIGPRACLENTLNGFDSLFPLQKLWLSMRNITFIFFVLVFVLIGIGIMLRIKIDPRTVMTLQNQLPKVVVSLVLISFSFAIVGFIIDMMWVGTYVGINILTSAHNPEINTCTDEGEELDKKRLKEQAYLNILNYPVAYMNDIFHKSRCTVVDGDEEIGVLSSGIINVAWSVGDAIGQVVEEVFTQIIHVPSGSNCNPVSSLPGVSGSFSIQACVAGVVQFFATIIGILIALLAVVIALFRLWWTLLKAYAYIVIYTITAPFWIMLGLLPNSSLGFSRWIRTVLANLMIFPAAALLIVGARIVMDLFGGGYTLEAQQLPGADPQPFVAPLVGNPGLEAFGALIAFGMLLIAPELLNTIREALKTPPSKLGDTIKSGFATGAGYVGMPISSIGGRMFKTHAGAPVGSISVRAKNAAMMDLSQNPGFRNVLKKRAGQTVSFLGGVTRPPPDH